MNSSISRFRPWLLALAAILGIEAAYWWFARPDPVARSNFLELRFAQPDVIQRYFAYGKMEELAPRSATILHVGDSSGFHAVIPPVVDSMLPGERYLNFGIATTIGFPGYYALAQHMLERHPSLHTLVIYFSMLCAYPQPFLLSDNPQLLGTDLANDLSDPARFMLRPPTLALREEVTNRVYYLNGRFRVLDAPRTDNSGYLTFRSIMTQVGGWTRETDNPDDLPPRNIMAAWQALDPRVAERTCPRQPTTAWDWGSFSRRTHIDIVLSEFADLVARHNARLVLIPNPIPTGSEAFREIAPIENEFRRFVARRPEVLLAPADVWPSHRFSVAAHVATPHAVASSERVARFLAAHPPRQGRAASAPPEPTPADRVSISAAQPFSGYVWDTPDRTTTPPSIAMRAGRSEALLHARVRPGAPYRLTIEVPPGRAEAAREALTVSVFGVLAEPEATEDRAATTLAFTIPEAAVSRHGGFLEILLSLRGLTAWPEAQTTDRPAAEALRVHRFGLERQTGPGLAALP